MRALFWWAQLVLDTAMGLQTFRVVFLRDIDTATSYAVHNDQKELIYCNREDREEAALSG